MFYFGGMTLGYLTPPARPTPAKNGATVTVGTEDRAADERVPVLKDLIARANWFSLYW